MSGKSSILVKFQYNQDIINEIKLFSPAIYHKNLQAWELPLYYLNKVLDTLVSYDSIDFFPLESEINEISEISFSPLTEEEIKQFKVKPFDHQIDCINFLLRQKKSLLLDSMGVGKTNEMIWYAEILKRRKLINHCLIICGVNAVKLNFAKEINKFSTESCRVLGMKVSKNGKISFSSINERAKELQNPIEEFFVIINIECLRNKTVIDAISKSQNKFGLICLDEAHKANNISSDQGHNLQKLFSPFKVAATGTLITNNPLSAYGPLRWTENDHSTLTIYKSHYCNFGGFNNSQIVGYKNLDFLQKEIDSCSIRRTFDMIKSDMPEKIIEYELIEMSDEQKEFYEKIKQGIKDDATKIKLDTNNLLALTTRLRQATAAPSTISTEQIESSKINRCAELIEELVEQNEKVVVLSNFIEPVNILATKLRRFHPLVNTGEIDDAIVSNNVDLFQNDPAQKIFLGTHSKCGTGISLPAAHYCIMIDTPWTYSQFSQSCDRIYRITSKQTVYIKVLACVNTIDERVLKIIDEKKEISDYLVDGVENIKFKDTLLDIINTL